MREITDPYKGMKYSDIIQLPQNVSLYKETQHPLIKVPGTGQARWDATIARWVV
jgi:hypothetical protein